MMKIIDKNILIRQIKDYWLVVLLSALLLITFCFANNWFIHVMNTDKAMEQMIKQLPSIFQSVLGFEKLKRVTNQHFMLLSYTHPFPLIVIFAFSIGLAAGSLAGEIESGTIEHLLARPVTRFAIVATTIGNLALGLMILVGSLHMGNWLGAAHFGLLFPEMIFNRVTFNLFLFHLAVAALALSLSAMLSEKGKVLMICLGFLLVQFFMDFFGRALKSLEFLKNFTLFSCFSPFEVLLTRQLNSTHLGILFFILIISFAFSLIYFQHRDIMK